MRLIEIVGKFVDVLGSNPLSSSGFRPSVGYLTGFTALVGVIIAHVKAGSTDEVLRSHYRFQIRTFWIGLLYLGLGWLLVYVLIGILILFWWLVWSMVHIIKGMVALNDGSPIAKPRSWLFG